MQQVVDARSAAADELMELNHRYVRSVQQGDVTWFAEHLAEDFLATNPDASLVNKQQFLEQTARPVTISELAEHDVLLRMLGDVCIIHASTSYRTADGKQHAGRYTDVWMLRDGRWVAVAAHVTR